MTSGGVTGSVRNGPRVGKCSRRSGAITEKCGTCHCHTGIPVVETLHSGRSSKFQTGQSQLHWHDAVCVSGQSASAAQSLAHATSHVEREAVDRRLADNVTGQSARTLKMTLRDATHHMSQAHSCITGRSNTLENLCLKLRCCGVALHS